MPAFDILYLNEDGSLASTFSVRFDDPMRAKILAHAMKPPSCRALEVRCGDELIYRRPENDRHERRSAPRADDRGDLLQVA